MPSASSVMRPRKSDPLATSIVEPISPERSASSPCGSHGTAEATWPCVGEKPGRPRSRSKSSSFVALELAALDRERADELVVPLRNVAGARRLRDLGVVQLGRVAVDVEDPAAEAGEGLDDEVFEDGLLGGAGADAVAADGVEADRRGAPFPAGPTRMASPARTSSRTGTSFRSAPANFMPSLASEPPATTATCS